METLLIAILALVLVLYLMRLTYLPIAGQIVYAVLTLVILGLGNDWASCQSKTQIADMLASRQTMQDLALALTVEVALHITFVILQGSPRATGVRRYIDTAIGWLAGLLFPLTLLSVEVYAIFEFTGVDFSTIGWTLGGIVAVATPLLAMGLRYLIPERELRGELIFVLSITVGLLAIVGTVNGQTATQGMSSVNVMALIGAVVLTVACALVGYVRFNIKQKK